MKKPFGLLVRAYGKHGPFWVEMGLNDCGHLCIASFRATCCKCLKNGKICAICLGKFSLTKKP